MTPIERAVSLVGGQSALARIIGIKPQSVRHWVVSGLVPPRRVIAIEEATGGKVTRQELRPDIYPSGRAA